MGVRNSFDSAIGAELAGYRIEALIGRGGMGAVYRAEEPGLGRKVALKVIASDLAADSRFRERFLRESQIAASLDHPHIVPIFRAGEADGVLFLAMRYVEGTDLAKVLASEGALEPRRTVALLEQVAEALDAAHERGLVHRDVKPSNVLIASAAGREHCYLADFGLTKRTASLSGLTAPGDVVGTLDYVAPEQITGDAVEPRSDLYSFGCVLYECLTGAPPFPRATDVALLWAHVHEQAERPSAIRPDLPRRVDPVLERALAKEPASRYPTCSELVSAALSALGLVETLPQPKRGGRRAAAAAAAAVVVVAVAAVSLIVLRSDSGGLSSVSPNAVGVIDPHTNRLAAEVPVGIAPESIASGAGAVWAANVEDRTVSRIDPGTRTVVRNIPVDGLPSDVAFGGGIVWVALGALAELTRINPEQNEAARSIAALGKGAACGAPDASVTFGAGSAWFACEFADLGRVEPRTGEAMRVGYEAGLLTSTSAVLPEFADIAFGLGSLWLVNRAANSVIEVDPTTIRRLRDITVGRKPSALAIGANAVWVANADDDTVTRIAIPGRGQAPTLTHIPVGDGPVDVAVGEGGVWVANQLGRSVSRIDPKTGDVVATIDVGNQPQGIAAADGAVWVTVGSSSQSS